MNSKDVMIDDDCERLSMTMQGNYLVWLCQSCASFSSFASRQLMAFLSAIKYIMVVSFFFLVAAIQCRIKLNCLL